MRRRLVWIQKPQQGEGLFLLYEGPDGYYVVAGESAPVLIAPYWDDQSPFGIFRAGFTTLGPKDWRFGATGLNLAGDNVLFYGPSGITKRYVTPVGVKASFGLGSGILLGAIDQNDGMRQPYWYTETAFGSGPNTWPDIPPRFALPDQNFGDNTGQIFQNADLSYAVRPGQLLAADGTLTPITSGEPSPFPGSVFSSGIGASFVGLTLFAYTWPPTGGSITFTPYRYDPATGTATAGEPFAKPYTDPGSGYTLRYVSYWTSNP